MSSSVLSFDFAVAGDCVRPRDVGTRPLAHAHSSTGFGGVIQDGGFNRRCGLGTLRGWWQPPLPDVIRLRTRGRGRGDEQLESRALARRLLGFNAFEARANLEGRPNKDLIPSSM